MDRKNDIKIKGRIFRAHFSAEINIRLAAGRDIFTTLIAYLGHKIFHPWDNIDYDEQLESYNINAFPAEIRLKRADGRLSLNAVRRMTDDVTWSVVFGVVGWLIAAFAVIFANLIIDAKYGRGASDKFVSDNHVIGLILIGVYLLPVPVSIIRYLYLRWKGVRDLRNSISDFIYALEVIQDRDMADDMYSIRDIAKELIKSRGGYEDPAVMARWNARPGNSENAGKELLEAMEIVFSKYGLVSHAGNMMMWKSRNRKEDMKVIVVPAGQSSVIEFSGIFEFDSTAMCAFCLPAAWTGFIAIFKFLPLILSGVGGYSGAAGILDYGLFPGWIIGIVISPFVGPLVDRIRFGRKSRSILPKVKGLAEQLERYMEGREESYV